MARFIVAGGTAASVDLLVLFIFTDIFKVWYIVSSAIAFLVAFMVSFTLQKYWTFRDHSSERLHAQALVYFVVTGINLVLNTLLMYFFVHFGGIEYLIAQIITGILIAIESYFVYQKFVFKNQKI